MSLTIDHIKKLHTISASVHNVAKSYHHTTPLAEINSYILTPDKRKHQFTFEYDIKDLMNIGAITESPILMIGNTDLGKTTLATLVMNGLFGKKDKGWHLLDFDTDFGKDTVTNVNFGELTNENGDLTTLYSLHEWMRFPGFIADEINGVHPKIGRKALHLINEKTITLPNGVSEKIGYKRANGETYQFQVAAINEGADYDGTFPIDRALRRRLTMELPMDNFMPSATDRQKVRNTRNKKPSLDNEVNYVDDIISILEGVKSLNISPQADLFLGFLEGFDFCEYSPSRSKNSVASKNGSYMHMCAGRSSALAGENTSLVQCPYLRMYDNELCPNVRGLSPGVSQNTLTVAKGFAALRAVKFAELLNGFLEGNNEAVLSYKLTVPEKFADTLRANACDLTSDMNTVAKKALNNYINNLLVEKDDVVAAISFVGHSKIGISKPYVDKYFFGDKHVGMKNFMTQAGNKFNSAFADLDNQYQLIKVLSGENNVGKINGIRQYCASNNPWMLKALEPRLNELMSQNNSANGVMYNADTSKLFM